MVYHPPYLYRDCLSCVMFHSPPYFITSPQNWSSQNMPFIWQTWTDFDEFQFIHGKNSVRQGGSQGPGTFLVARIINGHLSWYCYWLHPNACESQYHAHECSHWNNVFNELEWIMAIDPPCKCGLMFWVAPSCFHYPSDTKRQPWQNFILY